MTGRDISDLRVLGLALAAVRSGRPATLDTSPASIGSRRVLRNRCFQQPDSPGPRPLALTGSGRKDGAVIAGDGERHVNSIE